MLDQKSRQGKLFDNDISLYESPKSNVFKSEEIDKETKDRYKILANKYLKSHYKIINQSLTESNLDYFRLLEESIERFPKKIWEQKWELYKRKEIIERKRYGSIEDLISYVERYYVGENNVKEVYIRYIYENCYKFVIFTQNLEDSLLDSLIDFEFLVEKEFPEMELFFDYFPIDLVEKRDILNSDDFKIYPIE